MRRQQFRDAPPGVVESVTPRILDDDDGPASRIDAQEVTGPPPVAPRKAFGAAGLPKGSMIMEQRGYPRVILNDPASNAQQHFPSNHISSSKYTLWNFIPRNLFEQFRRVSNFYFLMVVVIQLVPQLSPLFPVTSILPLVFVLLVTAAKDGLEDYQRHQGDRKSNREQYGVLRDGEVVGTMSQDLVVGDIVRVQNRQQFPADLVLLSSSDTTGLAFVQTANLDGETNLKIRTSVEATALFSDPASLSKMRGHVESAPPNADLYELEANLVLEHKSSRRSHSRGASAQRRETGESVAELSTPLGGDQLLQRGAQLRNTDFVYGLVVFAGSQSKISLNQAAGEYSKFSTVERTVNKYILCIFAFQMALCLLSALLSSAFLGVEERSWYLAENPYDAGVWILRNFFTFFVLFNTFIPISLWVTMEFVKLVQAKFMEWDNRLTSKDDAGKSVSMMAKTSNLNDELGRVQHVFADKTGTLTENVMEFRAASVNGCKYSFERSKTALQDVLEYPTTGREEVEALENFLLCMAVCHEVVPEVTEKVSVPFDDAGSVADYLEGPQLVYQGESPDEATLVQTAAENGFRFIERRKDSVIVERNMEKVEYRLLQTLKFSSTRRRMSVIIERPDSSIVLLTKGADSVINERLVFADDISEDPSGDSDDHCNHTQQHLMEFSRLGLRTLLFAKRELTRPEYDKWASNHERARAHLTRREESVCASYDVIESELELMGCTAIEDQLQAEVPETIDFLKKAGMQVWVLTGDKRETAVNIGFACKLLTQDMDLIVVDNCTSSGSCFKQLSTAMKLHIKPKLQADSEEISTGKLMNILHRRLVGGGTTPRFGENHRPIGLIIGGSALSFALVDHQELLLEVAYHCDAVICTRATPSHKASIVRAVRDSKKNIISLAIGDGANDVNMIQTAHVGIGIFGKEGTHAAIASDYAIREFRHLRRLLAIHGRYSQIRMTGLVFYSFYKNITFTLALLYFGIYNGFTGTPLYDPLVMSMFNIIFTFVPPLFYGIFEKDLDESTLYSTPEAYRSIATGIKFTPYRFATWMASAVYHSLIIFFATTYAVRLIGVGEHLHAYGLAITGMMASTSSIVTVNLRMALELHSWSALTQVSIWGSILAYFVFVMIQSATALYFDDTSAYWIIFDLAGMPTFWLLLVLIPVAALFPDLAAKSWAALFYPSDRQILRELEKENPHKAHMTTGSCVDDDSLEHSYSSDGFFSHSYAYDY